VRPEGIHLTLKFLGYVDPDRIDSIVQSLTEAATGCAPATVRVQGCGAFPNTRRPNVLWAGVVAPGLAAAQTRVEEAMAALGFEKEQRAFQPHLTLARFRDPHGLTPLMLEVEKRQDQQLGEFSATGFRLYESILRREGAEYRVVGEFAL
jgi:2'-5' RNA ligase